MKVNAVPLLVLGLLGSGLAAPQGPANISPTVATNNGGASLGPANAIHNAPNGGGPLVPGGKPVTLPAPHNGGKPVTLPTPHNGGSSPLQPAGSPTQAKVKEAKEALALAVRVLEELVRDEPNAAKPLKGVIRAIETLAKTAEVTLNFLASGKAGKSNNGKDVVHNTYGNNAPKGKSYEDRDRDYKQYEEREDEGYWGH